MEKKQQGEKILPKRGVGKGKKKAKESSQAKKGPRVIIKNPTPSSICMELESQKNTTMFKRQELRNPNDNYIRNMEQRQQINEELSDLLFEDRLDKL